MCCQPQHFTPPCFPKLVYLSECLYFFISTPVLVVLLLSLSVHCWLCFLWFFCYFLIFLPFLTLLDLYLSHKDTVIKLLYLSSFTTNLVAFLVSMELSFMDPVAIFKACKETPAPHVRGYQTYVRASLSLSVSIYMHTMYVWMKYKCLTYKTSCYFSPSAFPFFLSLLTFFFPVKLCLKILFCNDSAHKYIKKENPHLDRYTHRHTYLRIKNKWFLSQKTKQKIINTFPFKVPLLEMVPT